MHRMCLPTVMTSLRSCSRRTFSHSTTGYPIAIIGTGPSAFYTAKYLLDQHPEVRVDLYERLPFPYGLVRYGVAPDHPEVKSVTHTFEEVMEKHQQVHSIRIRYYGHIEVRDDDMMKDGVIIASTNKNDATGSRSRGDSTSSNSSGGGTKSNPHLTHTGAKPSNESGNTSSAVDVHEDARKSVSNCISLAALRQHYSAVVLAYGADQDNALNIPGSDLPGVLSAHQFVNWYNGHPEYRHLHQTSFDLQQIKHVVIIEQGNVALDCARILTKDIDELATTDIAEYALEALKQSAIECVSVVGRRGHVQAAFTIKELRELTKLPGVGVHIDTEELTSGSNESSMKELENNRPKKRITDLIQQISSTPIASDCKRQIDIRFLLSPTSIESKIDDKGKASVGQITLARNELNGEPFRQQAKVKADHPPIKLPCDLLLASIGYQSSSISPFIPFDRQRHVVHNKQGRVTFDPKNSKIHYEGARIAESQEEQIINGVYVTGWLKRGPTGIIGSNITDAKETTASIIEDINNKRLAPKVIDPVRAIKEQSPQFEATYQIATSWEQVVKMNQYEMQLGEGSTPAKPRVKLTSIGDMLSVASN